MEFELKILFPNFFDRRGNPPITPEFLNHEKNKSCRIAGAAAPDDA